MGLLAYEKWYPIFVFNNSVMEPPSKPWKRYGTLFGLHLMFNKNQI